MKNHLIISIDAKKAFHKMQHAFMLKTLNKLDVDNKRYLWQNHSKYHTEWAKLEPFRLKNIQIKREKVKFSLFADDMIVYLENPIVTAQKLLKLISNFSKVSGYKELKQIYKGKSKQPYQKVGKGYETLLKRRHLCGQQTYEKKLIIIGH